MVQYRVYTEIRLREKRSFRKSQNKKKRTEEAVQNRRDNRAAERERLAVEDPAALAAKRATRTAKHERKLARRAEAAAAAAIAGASTQVLGEALVSEPAASRPATVDASTQVLGETVVDDSNIDNYDIGCEGYSDDEDYEYDNGHVAADEGFIFQLDQTSPDFKSYYLEHPVTYISFDFEGRYGHSGEIRECGITVLRIDKDALREIQCNPTQLPKNTKSYCLRVSDFERDHIPGWAWGKGLQVKKFLFGTQKSTRVRFRDLNDQMAKIVDIEKARNVPIRLVAHAAENKDTYCTKNDISAFKGLWGELIDTQVAWRHLDPKHKKPGLANLTENFLRMEGDRELKASMVHNAGNDSFLTMLLVGRLIERALSM